MTDGGLDKLNIKWCWWGQAVYDNGDWGN